MSNKALTWAFEAAIDNVGAKFVLVALADHASDHAGEDWTCFPSSERLATFTSMPMRTLERHLSWLFVAGWISRSVKRDRRGRMLDRSYTLHRDHEKRTALNAQRAVVGVGAEDPGPPANLAGGEGADHPPNEGGSTRQNGGVHPPLVAGGPNIAEPPEEPSGTPTGRARELAFVRAWDVYPDAGKRGVSGPRVGRDAFEAEVTAGGDPERMVEAARRYGADRAAWGASGRPVAFHRFFAEERWRTFGEALAGGARPERLAAVDGPVWPGPEELRTAFVEAHGADRAAAWLDPAGWDPASGAVLAATGVAERWIRDNAGAWLRANRLQVERAEDDQRKRA